MIVCLHSLPWIFKVLRLEVGGKLPYLYVSGEDMWGWWLLLCAHTSGVRANPEEWGAFREKI